MEGGDASELEELHAKARALCHGFLGPFKVCSPFPVTAHANEEKLDVQPSKEKDGLWGFGGGGKKASKRS